MKQTHTIEDFYRYRFNAVPDRLRQEIGHCNVFTIEDYVAHNAESIPFIRREAPNFNGFFRQKTQLSPTQFRKLSTAAPEGVPSLNSIRIGLTNINANAGRRGSFAEHNQTP
jgi:hypothetical protein